MKLVFEGTIWYWRGPAPFYFVTVPEVPASKIHEFSAASTYGWGMIPVDATIGDTTWYTALWPKDGGYIVPIKAAIRKAESLDVGDVVELQLDMRFREFDPFSGSFSEPTGK